MSDRSEGAAGTEEPIDIRKSFHQQLDELKNDIVRMAAMVTETIPRGTAVLLDGDLQAAQELIEGDDPLECVGARDGGTLLPDPGSPAADGTRPTEHRDRGSHDLGDRTVRRPGGQHRQGRPSDLRNYLHPEAAGLITEMGEEATMLFRLSIDAYVEGDAALAAALDDLDDRLDSIHRDYIQEIFVAHGGGGIQIQPGVQLALVGRYYERIGDHAVNIGERVRYMVTGWLPEQTGAAREAVRKHEIRSVPSPEADGTNAEEQSLPRAEPDDAD